jgi:hypothetical protein
MVTGKGSATRSTELEAHSSTYLLIYSRDLAESLDRIGSLEGENSKLLNALRAMKERPDFQPEEHTDIMDILAKVPTLTSPLLRDPAFF